MYVNGARIFINPMLVITNPQQLTRYVSIAAAVGFLLVKEPATVALRTETAPQRITVTSILAFALPFRPVWCSQPNPILPYSLKTDPQPPRLGLLTQRHFGGKPSSMYEPAKFDRCIASKNEWI